MARFFFAGIWEDFTGPAPFEARPWGCRGSCGGRAGRRLYGHRRKVGGRGDLTRQIAEKLEAQGFADVRILEGGYAAWERAGGETQAPSMEQIVPPSRTSEVQELDRRV